MDAIAITTENIQRWASFLKKIRLSFDSQGYFEVTTPSLVPQGAFESSIDPLKVSWNGGAAELHTSPEIQMKGLLAKARLPIYQICQCFRDDLDSPHHSREFTMLEFYRPNSDYRALIKETTDLILSLVGVPLSTRSVSVEELFQTKLGLSLSSCQDRDIFASEITKRGLVTFGKTDSWEDLFFRLMIEHIEPSLTADSITVLYNYPAAVSPLSKGIAGTIFAERFEIYWKGMELCNGCTELSDGAELKRRALKENDARKLMGKSSHSFSTTLLEATVRMGQMAGVALGLDRLFRCLYP